MQTVARFEGIACTDPSRLSAIEKTVSRSKPRALNYKARVRLTGIEYSRRFEKQNHTVFARWRCIDHMLNPVLPSGSPITYDGRLIRCRLDSTREQYLARRARLRSIRLAIRECEVHFVEVSTRTVVRARLETVGMYAFYVAAACGINWFVIQILSVIIAVPHIALIGWASLALLALTSILLGFMLKGAPFRRLQLPTRASAWSDGIELQFSKGEPIVITSDDLHARAAWLTIPHTLRVGDRSISMLELPRTLSHLRMLSRINAGRSNHFRDEAAAQYRAILWTILGICIAWGTGGYLSATGHLPPLMPSGYVAMLCMLLWPAMMWLFTAQGNRWMRLTCRHLKYRMR